MASLDDVEQAIAQTIASLVFPGQAYQFMQVADCTARATAAPGAPAIVIPTRLAPGSPTTDAIEADIKTGTSGIYISKFKGFSRNTTRFAPQTKQTSMKTPTITFAFTLGGPVTFGGAGGPNQGIVVQVGKTQYAYLATSADTPASVASAFAAMIPSSVASGAVLTVANIVTVRIAAWQSGLLLTGTKEQLIQTMILATPTAAADGYAVRAALGSCVDRIQNMLRPNGSITQWIGLADGSQARVRYHDEFDDDTPSRNDIWRRWVNLRVEYDTAIHEDWPVLLAPLVSGVTNGVHMIWFGPGAPAAKVLTDGLGNLLADQTGATLGART